MTRLSVCIATFNRSKFIGETLDGLMAQAPPDLEVVVLDGGSTAATEQIVSDYARRYPAVRYFRQPTNMGVDRDFDNAVQRATGEYCWLMSDDDLLKPGALQRVVEETARGYDLIIVNAESRTNDLSSVLIPNLLKLDEDRTYGAADGDRLLGDTGRYLSFIGGVVIKRSRWNARAREPYFGSLFIHVGVIFQAPLASVLVIADPLVVIRYGNAMWTSRGFEIWMFKWPWLIWSFNGFSDAAKTSVTTRQPWRKATTLMLFRARGAYAWADYRRWLHGACRSAAERLMCVAVALTPGALAHAMVTFYMTRRHPEPAVALFELRHSRFHYAHYLSGIRRFFTREA